MAKKFNFYLDQKVTVWERTSFEITAETEDEAKEIAKKFLNTVGTNDVADCDDDAVEFIETETLYETEDDMSVEDNGGMATMELYCGGTGPANMVADNTML